MAWKSFYWSPYQFHYMIKTVVLCEFLFLNELIQVMLNGECHLAILHWWYYVMGANGGIEEVMLHDPFFFLLKMILEAEFWTLGSFYNSSLRGTIKKAITIIHLSHHLWNKCYCNLVSQICPDQANSYKISRVVNHLTCLAFCRTLAFWPLVPPFHICIPCPEISISPTVAL